MTRKKRKKKGPKAVLTSPGFATSAIHGGSLFNEETGAITPPIFATSTFAHDNAFGFDYTRSGNPNFVNLSETLAKLEGAQFATVFSSGVAAITAVVSSLSSGDTIFAEENLYGCTYRLFEQVFRRFGVRVVYRDLTAPKCLAEIKDYKPKLVWIESPTNPMLKVLDIKAISAAAHRVGSTVVVDNTFASSLAQRPLQLGADLSLASTTKYVNGHCDCLGGVVCTNSETWQAKMMFAQKALGLQPSPFDAWLVSRGAKTLALRMPQQSQNALKFAQSLEALTCVRFVRYPFLASHPQVRLAKRQMRYGSGIVTVDFNLEPAAVRRLLKALNLFTLAESLGGIESLVCHPATMTHASIPPAEKKRLGISSSLVRFSLGIEEIGDLLADLQQALRPLRPKDRSLDQLGTNA